MSFKAVIYAAFMFLLIGFFLFRSVLFFLRCTVLILRPLERSSQRDQVLMCKLKNGSLSSAGALLCSATWSCCFDRLAHLHQQQWIRRRIVDLVPVYNPIPATTLSLPTH
mmetsp:Transcript_24597/g.36108  ORF Transcript_24597/g.36108 Transcript_24597/m.36108 type:complete len:110 (+) Transcript_24597:1804-2133(+)